MAPPEVTGKKPAVDDTADAYSPQFFYKFKHLMPPTIHIGARRLISREAAAAWRREREQAAAQFANTS